MIAKLRIFALLSMAFAVGVFAQEDCEPITEWYAAIEKCLKDPGKDDRCFRNCIQDDRGFIVDKKLSEEKIEEKTNQFWTNKTLAAVIIKGRKECVAEVESITDQCERGQKFGECSLNKPETKEILKTKICKNELTKYIVSED